MARAFIHDVHRPGPSLLARGPRVDAVTRIEFARLLLQYARTHGPSCVARVGGVSGDVLDGDGVLDGEAVALALDPRPIDERPRVRLEPRARQHDVGVQSRDLAHGPGVLMLGGGVDRFSLLLRVARCMRTWLRRARMRAGRSGRTCRVQVEGRTEPLVDGRLTATERSGDAVSGRRWRCLQ